MKKTLLTIGAVMLASTIADSRPPRVGQIPNGNANNCLSCHVFSSGGGLNPFGRDVSENLTPQGTVIWANLYDLDSDNDGFSNGLELQDPDGVWSQGMANPGDASLVTAPGDADDFPTSVDEPITDFRLIVTGNTIHLVSATSSDLNLSYRIYSVDGRLMTDSDTGYGNTDMTINIDELSGGNYYLVMQKGKKTFTRGFSKVN